MKIVDAQIHIFNTEPPSGAWHRKEPYSAEQALADMDAGGIDRAVLNPISPYPDAIDLALDAARRFPDRFAVMGWFPPDRPELRGLVETWKQQPGMLGLRYAFSQPNEKSWPTDGTMDWLWPAAERAGVPVAVRSMTFLPPLAQIAERHPGLKLIIDHMGVGRGSKTAAEAYQHLPELLALAKYPNVAVKSTGQAGYAEDEYPFRSVHPYLHRAFDAFGPDRMFWGTDITRMKCSWRQCVTMYTEEMPWLKGRDLELVMGRAFCNWAGWDLPE